MNKIKLNAAKSLFVVALLCPAAFADGDQGSGGLANYEPPVVKTSETALDGDQGSGGLSANSFEDTNYLDSVLNSVFSYFDSMI